MAFTLDGSIQTALDSAMNRASAFTLVELSIVLVILGLLVGGILAGQSLIHAAEIRSISTDFQRYQAASSAFRDKYFANPGDFTKATQFWGSIGGTGADATCFGTTSAGSVATCNGDGDGSMLNSNGSNESGRYWQHLANAGLIEGSYNGLVSATSGATPGTNVPVSRLASNYFVISAGLGYPATFAGNTKHFAANYGPNIFYYTSINAIQSTAGSMALSPEDAWNVDVKMDDGVPNTGNIMSNKGDGTNTFCTNVAGATPPDTSATYKLTNTNKDCWLIFMRFM